MRNGSAIRQRPALLCPRTAALWRQPPVSLTGNLESNSAKLSGTHPARANSRGICRAQTSRGQNAGPFRAVCKFPFAQQPADAKGLRCAGRAEPVAAKNRNAYRLEKKLPISDPAKKLTK